MTPAPAPVAGCGQMLMAARHVADHGDMTPRPPAEPGKVPGAARERRGPAPFTSVIDAEIAEVRLGLLRDIVTASRQTSHLDELLTALADGVARRYPGTKIALLSRNDLGWAVEYAVGVDDPADFDFAAIAASALPERLTRQIAPLVAPSALPAIVIPIAGALLTDRALVFADPDQVVHVPREIMAFIAEDCTYVLHREVEHHRLIERETFFRAVFDASPIPQALMPGGRHDQLIVNDAFCKLVGYRRAELTGARHRRVTHPDDRAAVAAAERRVAADPSGQVHMARRMVHASGEIVYTQSVLNWITPPDGGTPSLLMQFQDVTSQRRAELDRMRQAELDSLTGIGNRLQLVRRIDELAELSEAFGVLFLDVDNFKSINDTRGHDVGDEILREVASRLTMASGPGDLVVRFGGDEFVILCRRPELVSGDAPPPTIAESVRVLADRAQRVLAEPVVTSSGPAQITVSIGICDDTIPVARALDRLQYADTAAYQAKRLGEDRQVVYDSGLHRQSLEYSRMESLLRTALEEDRFVMHFQPIVDLADGRAVGVEALVRMTDHDGNLVPPGEFIEVAERSGLIVPMGSWVMAEACRAIAALHRSDGVPLRVSVNVAARQAARPDLVTAVYNALAQADMPPEALTLELTESALLEADASTLARLKELRESGVRIALDDFGTGYSSLVYLRQFPVTSIKVDRSFVSPMTTDPGSAAIVKAVTRLAGDLGLSWIAEGVETVEQWQALAELGQGRAQGFHFARPQPASALVATLHGLPPR